MNARSVSLLLGFSCAASFSYWISGELAYQFGPSHSGGTEQGIPDPRIEKHSVPADAAGEAIWKLWLHSESSIAARIARCLATDEESIATLLGAIPEKWHETVVFYAAAQFVGQPDKFSPTRLRSVEAKFPYRNLVVADYAAQWKPETIVRALATLPNSISAQLAESILLSSTETASVTRSLGVFSDSSFSEEWRLLLRNALFSEAVGISFVADCVNNPKLRAALLDALGFPLPKVLGGGLDAAIEIHNRISAADLSETDPTTFFEIGSTPESKKIIVEAWIQNVPLDSFLTGKLDWLNALPNEPQDQQASLPTLREFAVDSILEQIASIDPESAFSLHAAIERKYGVTGNLHNGLLYFLQSDVGAGMQIVPRIPKGTERDPLIEMIIGTEEPQGDDLDFWSGQLSTQR